MRHLEYFNNIVRSGLKLIVCQRFQRVPFSRLRPHVHTQTVFFPVWGSVLKSSVFSDRFHRIHVGGSRIRKEKVTFSNEKGYE